MIKVGICGGDDLCTGELVRVLINHPDVELRWVTSAGDAGTRVDALVPGLVGDCDLETSCELTDAMLEGIDLVMVCRWPAGDRDWMSKLEPEARIIDVTGQCHDDATWTTGMPEMMRRVLVHDCMRTVVPGAATIATLLTLLPLARNLLLNSAVTLRLGMGADALRVALGDNKSLARWLQDEQRHASEALTMCQTSFAQPLDMTVTRLSDHRALVVAARVHCAVDATMLRELYEQYYDDHNFVFIVDRPCTNADVENTNKCLLRLLKDERSGVLTVQAVMDGVLKGCAGTAVHDMNLMFGLYERVGLMFKATGC